MTDQWRPGPSRRRNTPQTYESEYISVPQVPHSPPRSRGSVPPQIMRNGSSTRRLHHHARSSSSVIPPIRTEPSPIPAGSSFNAQRGARETAQSVQNHILGGGFGPYAHGSATPQVAAPPQRGPSMRSHERSRSSISLIPDQPLSNPKPYTTAAATEAVGQPFWDGKDELDPLHDPDPLRDAREDQYCEPFSGRGWFNMTAVLLICFGLITLFAGYPIISWAGRYQAVQNGYNMGGINGSGQVPILPGLPDLIDSDTPQSVYTRVGSDQKKYDLVFSDEFNRDGRTFWPGDDAFWEAVDIHYWATGDLEWYAPDAVTTKDGSLVITMIEQITHDLNFRSGMLQSWNKLCFSSGYVEVNVSLPGSHLTAGFWPGVWTMGNLGRAGYGATTEGMWPYSYDTCDSGTYPGQQDHNGNPSSNQTLGKPGETLSALPGQKVSACTCPGSDHPGPSVKKGRGVPEIDVLEAQIETTTWQGQVSQSFQVAPFNSFYQFDNSSASATLTNSSNSHFNPYKGGIYQQAVSAVTDIPNTSYGGTGWSTYGYELWGDQKDRENSYITWYVDGQVSWTAKASTVGADAVSQISQRLISEEPMYLIFNLGMARSFQAQDWMHLQFPAEMLIDYVRIYQRQGSTNIGCSPSDHPTTDYINQHIGAYTNANFTTWQQAGYRFPRNSLYDGC